jgi:hypothetical protein
VTGLQEAFEELDGKYINQNQINQANGVAGITRYGYISSSLIPVSSEIIEGSTMPVTSGAVHAAIQYFVTVSVSNLINYYTKSQTYSKSEVDNLISSIKQFTYQSADSLPTASASTMYKIYLIPAANSETNNAKDEYITVENGSNYSWEKIGSTNIDLSGYYQKPASGIPASDLASGVIPDISGKADKSEMSIVAGTDENSDKTTITLKSGTSATVLTTHQDISGKQNTLTFDIMPTTNSTNPVTSGGIKSALDAKQDTLIFDSAPTANSIKPVTSGGVKSALDAKDNKVTVVNHGTNDTGTSSTSYSITPNIFHVWGEVTALYLDLAAGEAGVRNEYMFRFYSGTTPTTLNLPSTVQWVQPLTCQQDKYYEVSIIDNLAVYITSGMAAAESSGGTPEYATKDWVTNKIETEIDGGYYYV